MQKDWLHRYIGAVKWTIAQPLLLAVRGFNIFLSRTLSGATAHLFPNRYMSHYLFVKIKELSNKPNATNNTHVTLLKLPMLYG